jgi:two-component system, NtrC family, response regulator GlrR
MHAPKFLLLDICENKPHDGMVEVIRNAFNGCCVLTTKAFPTNSDEVSRSIVLLHSSLRQNVDGLLATIRRSSKSAPLLGIFCGEETNGTLIDESLAAGMDDFLFCPLRQVDLIPRVRRLVHSHTEAEPSVRARELKASFHLDWIVGESAALMAVVYRVPNLAASDATILISGETGTGKEVLARAIHQLSPRSKALFVPINCGAVPESLFESEFFGHMKGAFTDASSSATGLIKEADGGTLFLDEVDALSLSSQVKLLRFLQNQEYRVLGSARSMHADVRIIAATNVNLQQQIAAKLFREDLYYRLNTLRLSVPALRARLEDVPTLANHFMGLYSGIYQRSCSRLTPSALQKLLIYSWPGNVRELEAVIHRAVLTVSSSVIDAVDIDLPNLEIAPHSEGNFDKARSQAVLQFERAYLLRLLAENSGNVSQAARRSGKPRRSLQRLLQKHGLTKTDFSSEPKTLRRA